MGHDGTAYTTVERAATVAPTSSATTPPPARAASYLQHATDAVRPQKPLEIADYVWSDDGSKLLIFTNTRKVWRLNTRGDYWVLSLSTEAAKRAEAKVERAAG